jgi:signal transduction histidine kinase
MPSEKPSRGSLGERRVRDQEEAFRRVATLVLEERAPSELFAAVVEEVVGLLHASAGWLVRYQADGSATVLASSNEAVVAVGSQLGATVARAPDCGSALGVPITVDGAVWGGLVCALSAELEPLPAEAEGCLRDFGELVATAVSNARADDDLRRLVREKAGLTRVATIVAEGVPPAELFAVLTQEVAQALDVPAVSLLRYEADRSTVVLASLNDPELLVGARSPLDGRSLARRVIDTGRAARAESELRAEVGVPIVVDGEVWGLIRAARPGPEPLRADVEASLRDFTELVATAISRTESRESLRRVVAEQAALRNIATLVAEGAAPAEVFSAVARQVARVLAVSAVSIVRFESDAWSVAVASFNDPVATVGSRRPLQHPSLDTTVFETGKPAQIDYSERDGPDAAAARSAGLRVRVGVPIIIEGRVWGMIAVGERHRRDALPAFAGSYTGRIVLSTASPRETQTRLGAFTELVATAIANAQAQDEVRWFGEEQAALGRVATLVATGAAPEQVFTAVVEEASRLVGLERIELVRYDGDDAKTVIAATGDHALPGASQSRIAAPLTVEGSLWGVIVAASAEPEPISERSHARLGRFTGLVATAVANAEARQALERVAAERATLHRIATLVARGVQPEEVFAAVVEEASATFTGLTALVRFERDPPGAVVVAASNETRLPVGMRQELAEGTIAAEVRRTGRPARLGADEDDGRGVVYRVACPILVERVVWGAIAVGSGSELPPDTEQRLEKFTGLVATAIANAEARSQLAASRRRIVAAADEARRRIERDLHDGIQQRLIALGYRARLMTQSPPEELPGIAAELLDGLYEVSDELQEVSRGIHPVILTRSGLGPALRALARRSRTRTELAVSLDERLPAPIEAAAYYIASEALTNVEKHAEATVVAVTVAADDGTLTLKVRDDGIGGVDARRGSGILGLADRVEALGGRFVLESPTRRGTTISVELPIDTPDAP